MKIARQHGGAFLCDGVGLGKTFVGLMLIERLVLHEGKRVVLFAPKAAKEGVWEPHLREWLRHIGGVSGDFSNLVVFSHTDLNRGGDFPERFERIAELADAVVIDEAHHFRNSGRQGRGDGVAPSRYNRLYQLLDNAERPKTLFLLTATPINNRLSDFRHMAELFTRRDEAHFARTLGVSNLRSHFNRMEKALRDIVGGDEVDLSEHLARRSRSWRPTRSSRSWSCSAAALTSGQDWSPIELTAPHFFFVPKHFEGIAEYEMQPSIARDVFVERNAGIQTKRDRLVYSFSKTELKKVLSDSARSTRNL